MQFKLRAMFGFVTIVACTLGVFATISHLREENRQFETANRRAKFLRYALDGLHSIAERNAGATVATAGFLPLLTRSAAPDGFDVGWRLVWSFSGGMEGEPPTEYGQWSDREYDLADDASCVAFCLENLKDQPRHLRFTRIMAFDGCDSAYNQIRMHGWEAVQKMAPDAILLAEVVNSRLPWMAPGDLDQSDLVTRINPENDLGIGTEWHGGWIAVGFVDGAVWMIDKSIPFDLLNKFFTVESASKVDRETILGEYVRLKLAPL